MKVEQTRWSQGKGWIPAPPGKLGADAQLVLLFGSPACLKQIAWQDDVVSAYPNAHRIGCSTAGEIYGTEVTDETLVSTAIAFEHTRLHGVSLNLDDVSDSYQAGERLANSLPHESLVHVLVFSDGQNVNGSELVSGLTQNLPAGVTLTGGLAGDGDRFQETLVLWDGPPEPNIIAVIGLYGERIKIGFGSLGGWDAFGPERLVTRSAANILYELDNQPALALYKKYLGEHAKDLPASGLLFPLSLRNTEGESVVRTILGVNEAEQSLTFAGDMPQGGHARLMKANFDRLIDGAVGAAQTSYKAIGNISPELALLISCVGRKLVLKQRIEEEVEGVQDVLGQETVLAGFYSYGEISPFTPSAKCELHNQTMTITTLSEL
ncbi:MAG TPA: FIST N-terminal domain-containing protein [Anaerolineales bacterium]|nr:FIST N-terminal domain-containing protein [Anaerolineales bacterium]